MLIKHQRGVPGGAWHVWHTGESSELDYEFESQIASDGIEIGIIREIGRDYSDI